jgi:ferric-dicitrate binding protein FerR (iron transport regulator)
MDINKIISKLLNDKASREELEVLEKWKSESEANIQELQELIKISRASEELKDYKEYDVDEALSVVEAKINNNLPDELKNTLRYKRILIIALLIVSLLASGLFLLKKLEIKQGPIHYQAREIAQTINLEDGSIIKLDKYSSLITALDFTNNRSVSLKGRAFFNINHISENNEFKISVPNAEIKVIGTQFSVFSDSTKTEVSVVSGIVEVSSQNRKISLRKGDFLLFENNDFIKTENRDPNYFGWNSGELIFSDTNMLEILRTLAWSYSIEINVENIKNISDCNYTTKYTNMDLDDILEELKMIADLKYEYNNGVIIVKSINCS